MLLVSVVWSKLRVKQSFSSFPIKNQRKNAEKHCSQNVVNSTVISRTPQESAGKELIYKPLSVNVIAT
jgi:hypothetical protein